MKEPMIKRLFDIFLSSVGLVCSSPLWILFSLAIWLEDRGPLFYTQDRVGKNGRIFKAYKFRSMIPDAEKHIGAVWASENDPRITKVGRILRATVLSVTLLYTFFFRHSRANGNPEAVVLDSCFRRNDRLSKGIYKTGHYRYGRTSSAMEHL
jgi:hypothetical protein